MLDAVMWIVGLVAAGMAFRVAYGFGHGNGFAEGKGEGWNESDKHWKKEAVRLGFGRWRLFEDDGHTCFLWNEPNVDSPLVKQQS